MADYRDEPVVIPEFEPFARAIGILSIAWNHLEHKLNDFIWELTNADRQIGACVTAQMIGPGPRIRAIAALMRLRGASQELINEFNSLGAEIEGTGRKRNRLMHDQILQHTDSKVMVRVEITADRVPKFEAVAIEIKDIHKISLDCEKLEHRLTALASRTINESPSWPRTQYEQSVDIAQLGPPKRGNSA